ncbi:hypothetical protein H2200_011676 [Cladophialophora chaetospira]|uniref:Uncharacterized protein n=1 Tax=Cladophialophora chaetospira TaxID=386627 RepID=A0AA38WZV0_9EURO|nr:hypothetical protein H2200_011676 [Cladophialophora chaetospira]
MASSSEESLALSSTRSSTRSYMKIAMPAPQSAFVHPSPAYVIASTPSPAQNPNDASWHPETQEDHHHHHSHRVHISTPHPLAATANFLDKHVPIFAKHHNEFQTQHEIRQAKRDARRSIIDTPIPEVDAEHLPGGSVGAAIQAVTATAAGPALADSHHALDPQAWSEILAKREAARLRSGSDMSRPDEKLMQSLLDQSDSESKNSMSPAISP